LLRGSLNGANLSILGPVPIYRLHDTTGDELGLLEHPAPNLEPGDVGLEDGRALVTARVETEGGPLAALLEVVGPKHLPFRILREHL
jgi:hypothetical protein